MLKQWTQANLWSLSQTYTVALFVSSAALSYLAEGKMRSQRHRIHPWQTSNLHHEPSDASYFRCSFLLLWVIVGLSHGVPCIAMTCNDINSWRLNTRKKEIEAFRLPTVGGNSQQRFGMIRLFVSWWSKILYSYSIDVALALSLTQRVRSGKNW